MRQPGTSDRPDLQWAVIIGAGGLSVAVARRLSQRYRVLIADIDASRAENAAQILRQEGGDASSWRCDITDPSSVAALADRVEALGGFRVLAHVAGLSPSMGDFDTIIKVNLTGPALIADAFLPLAAEHSAAIFTASLAAHNFTPQPSLVNHLRNASDLGLAERLAEALGHDQATPPAAYQLSKYGLLMLCRRSATAWGARGARILSVSPGLIATPMGAQEFEKSSAKMKLYSLSPLQREGTMLEIADAFEFLSSDRASFISGTDILVDGGLAGALSDTNAL